MLLNTTEEGLERGGPRCKSGMGWLSGRGVQRNAEAAVRDRGRGTEEEAWSE